MGARSDSLPRATGPARGALPRGVCLAQSRALLLHARRRKELSPAVARRVNLSARGAREFSPGAVPAPFISHLSVLTPVLSGVLGDSGVLGVLHQIGAKRAALFDY